MLIEVREEFVQLQREVSLRGHGIQIAVDAIDHDHPHAVFRHGPANAMHEFAGRNLRRIDLLDDDQAALQMRFHDRCPSCAARLFSVPVVSSKMNRCAFSPRSAADTAKRIASVDFPVPGGPMNMLLVPRPEPAAEQGVELLDSARKIFADEFAVMLSGDQTRKNAQARHGE